MKWYTAAMHLLVLAKAEGGDPSLDNIRLMLFGVMAIVSAGGLAFVPIRLAVGRRVGHAQVIVVLAVLWGLLTVGSSILAASAKQQWSREELLLLQSGYYDPHEHQHDPPATPWMFWGMLAAAYGGIVAGALLGRRDGHEVS